MGENLNLSRNERVFFSARHRGGGKGCRTSDQQGSSWEKRGCVRTKGCTNSIHPPPKSGRPLVPKLARLILDSLRPFLPPSLSPHARTHYSNHRTIHCEKDRNIKTWNAFFILARTRYRGRFRPSSGKHLQIDPWPDSKYVETSCSIRLGYYRGLGHRTGFLESSAKCAPDWTDTLEGCRATRIRDKPTPDPINFGQRAPTDFSNSSPRKDKRVLSFLENARERKETRDRSRRGREISGNTNGAIRNNSRGRRGTSWLRRIYEFN